MDPVTYHLPAQDGINPASIIDCGGAALRQCLDYGARSFQWRHLLFPLTESLEPVPLEAVTDELLEQASIDNYDETIVPEGCTVRRLVTHAVVLAIVADEKGNHIAEAAEIRALAAPVVDSLSTIVTPESGLADVIQAMDDDDDWEWDDDEEDEDEDDEEDDEDEDEDEELDERFPVA